MASCTGQPVNPRPWSSIVVEVARQFARSDKRIPRYVGNRTKQWLAYLRREYAGAQQLFARIKPLHDTAAIEQAIHEHMRVRSIRQPD